MTSDLPNFTSTDSKDEEEEVPLEKSLTIPVADLEVLYHITIIIILSKDAEAFDAEFQKIAQLLLNEVTLVINGKPHR